MTRILSLNCQRGHRRKELELYISEIVHEYDVLCLQELDSKTHTFLEKLSTHTIVTLGEHKGRGVVAIAVSVKHPFDEQIVRIPSSGIYSNPLYTFGMIGVKVKNTFFGSVHLPAGFALSARLSCIHSLHDFFHTSGMPDAYVAGDLNSLFSHEIQHFKRILAPYHLSTPPAFTYIVQRLEPVIPFYGLIRHFAKILPPNLFLDHIIGTSPVNVICIDNDVSDHLPLVFEVGS